jgi:3'(2'), 5'-bisphosphate nucleotidase
MTQAETDINMQNLIPSLITLSKKAGGKILRIYDTKFDTQEKEDKSPLTAADMASHKTICDGLQELTPNIPVLSEESAAIPYKTRKSWDQYWLVDPLDGTKEFIKRNGEFTVNIALIQNNVPVMGVVYVPVTDICYYASRGAGAFKQEADGKTVQIFTRETQDNEFIIAGSRSHGSEQQEKFLQSLGTNVEMIAIGSSLKICLVAEGTVDIYPRFGLTSEWDTAAAHSIALEAGAQVVDTDFNPLLYNTKDSLLNPFFLVIADTNFDWKRYLPGSD